MNRPEYKLLRFPDGREVRSEDIARVNLFPDMSPEMLRPYVQVFTAQGLFYEGFIDLERVAVGDCPPPLAPAAATAGEVRARSVR